MQINTRGMSCPQPVIMAKNAVAEKPVAIEILVDTGAPKSNVTRFLKNAGYKVEVKDDEDGAILIGRR